MEESLTIVAVVASGKDAVEDDQMEVEMGIEGGAEAVQEADGAEPGIDGRTGTGVTEGVDRAQENPEDGSRRPLASRAPSRGSGHPPGRLVGRWQAPGRCGCGTAPGKPLLLRPHEDCPGRSSPRRGGSHEDATQLSSVARGKHVVRHRVRRRDATGAGVYAGWRSDEGHRAIRGRRTGRDSRCRTLGVFIGHGLVVVRSMSRNGEVPRPLGGPRRRVPTRLPRCRHRMHRAARRRG